MNYLSGGRLGDFIHCLSAVKFNYDETGLKGDIYLRNYNDLFTKPIEFTINDLKGILLKQNYISSVNIYNDEPIDINLSKWRDVPVTTTPYCWSVIAQDSFIDKTKPFPKNYKWIECDSDPTYKDSLFINRRHGFDERYSKAYDKYITQYEGNVYFIGFDEEQYHDFPFKDRCKFLKVTSLYEWFYYINSCSLYIGNLTGTFNYACALNKPRVIERQINEQCSFDNDVLYYDNLFIMEHE